MCRRGFQDLLKLRPSSLFKLLFFLLTPPMKMEQTEYSEMLAYQIQTPGNHPIEKIQHSEHGESLKSRTTDKFKSQQFVVLIQGINTIFTD